MAWLIALALFWGIGLLVAKGIDQRSEYSRKQKAAHAGQIQAVKGNIYAIAWKECMDIQYQFYKDHPDAPSGSEFLPYYAAVRKREDGMSISIQQQSVINALIDLRKSGHEVIQVRNDKAEIVPPYREYQILDEAEAVRGVLPPIYGPFDFQFASKVTDERAQAIFKKVWNREVLGTNIFKWDKHTGELW